ncbi:hypothetical protein [Streptomyces stackebrandtii]|uniref:hypothetical protein n=1 Tax=Streptomyces stackebrandtii TaxID=3051177 RepID=UPI0028DCADBC|nr:hypothetical protein [Streptomyces sp. DSM 40976]
MPDVNTYFPDPTRPRPVLPGEYPLWEEALGLVNRDLAATLPDQEPLRLMALPAWDGGDGLDGARGEDLYVTMANGEWQGNCLEASAENRHADAVASVADAVASVADAAQETVSELLWQAWPVCGEHGTGMHPRVTDGEVAWWCSGGRSPREPEHIRAAVGALDTLGRPHRPNRKQRRRER